MLTFACTNIGLVVFIYTGLPGDTSTSFWAQVDPMQIQNIFNIISFNAPDWADLFIRNVQPAENRILMISSLEALWLISTLIESALGSLSRKKTAGDWRGCCSKAGTQAVRNDKNEYKEFAHTILVCNGSCSPLSCQPRSRHLRIASVCCGNGCMYQVAGGDGNVFPE